MKRKISMWTFLSLLSLSGLILGCESSNSGEMNTEILALAQTPNNAPNFHLPTDGTNHVINGDREINGAWPFVVRIIVPQHSSACTGAMIAEHWILTAAHCVVGLSYANVEVYYTPAGGNNVMVHNGRGDFYVHPGYRAPKKDLALIHLRAAIYSIPTFPEKAQFFLDRRAPWRDRRQPNSYFFAGYGQGSDYGTNLPCQEGTDGVKRWYGAALNTSYLNDTLVKGRGFETAEVCAGDSGLPFIFHRSIGGNDVPLIFAVLAANSPTEHTMFGNLIENQMDWILNTMKDGSPYRIYTTELLDEWKRVSYAEGAYIFAEIKGPGGKCLDVSGGRNDPGTPVQLYSCNGSAAQKWIIDPAGPIYYKDGLCLDMGIGQTGVQFTVKNCNNLSIQKFAIQKDGPITGPFGNFANLCITARNGSTADGTPIEFQQCNGSYAQQWTWHDDF
ncbi:hypothetical protein CH373_00370 [Leptospira perolatii]|uniref:Peptidase S1 domain-containing protein n=1 Tax=Leptospira perolatii TaxID=2023191 RepID=A0A2M9ZR95_9LEPT|nr:ricin-type beta-trefoil lectin domain protein [Leptospira perolatii]PJZ71023.1 hypothetical protein CH360_00370 [Leptospira perolatii]PJZ74555.1 hypothetical protein CH373_00370 [Leptospira perolatii]